MPHVASATKAHALKPPSPQATRSAPGNDRAQTSSFESMLDDNAAAAADHATPSPDKGKASPSAPAAAAPARPQPGTVADAAAPTEAGPTGAAPAGDTAVALALIPGDPEMTGGKIAKSDGAEKDDKATVADQAADPNQIVATAVVDQPSGDRPVTGAEPPANTPIQVPTAYAAATPQTEPVGTVASMAGAAASVSPPVTVPAEAEPAPAPAQAEAVAPDPDAGDAPAGDAAAETKSSTGFDLNGLAAKLDKTGKPDKTVKPGAATASTAALRTEEGTPPMDDTSAATASQPQADGAPASPATAEADNKQHAARARGEAPANGHQSVNADAPAIAPADTGATAARAASDTATPQVLTAHAATAAAPAAAATAPNTPQATAVPLAGVAIEIASRAVAGKNRFEIRLDPAELGRIEVHLNVDRNGHVTSHLIADRADTLDLLRRDSSGLERALQDAGLKTGDNGLQFSLRDQTGGQEQRQNADTARLLVKEEPALPDTLPPAYGRLTGRGSGLDIRV